MIHLFKREEIADLIEAIYHLAETHATLLWVWDSGFDFRIGAVDEMYQVECEYKGEKDWYLVNTYHKLSNELQNPKEINWHKIEEVVSALAYAVYRYQNDPYYNEWYENKTGIKTTETNEENLFNFGGMDNIVSVQKLTCQLKDKEVHFNFAKKNQGYIVFSIDPIFKRVFNTGRILISGKKVTNRDTNEIYTLNEEQRVLKSAIEKSINSFNNKIVNQ
jgi:hypothetical protein